MKSFIYILTILQLYISNANADGLWTSYRDMSDIKCLAVHGDYIWCGTENGAFRFDSYDGSSTFYSDINGLIDNNVKYIDVDSKGTAWFGTYKGVSKFDGTTWTSYNNQNGLTYNDIAGLAVDSLDRVWITSNISEYAGGMTFKYTNVLQIYDSEKWEKKWSYGSGGGGWSWIGILKYNKVLNSLWGNFSRYYSNERFVVQLNFESPLISYSSFDTSDKSYKIAIDNKGGVWYWNKDIQHYYDGLQWFHYNLTMNGTLIEPNDIAFDSNNNLWLGLNDGLIKYDGQSMVKYNSSNGFPPNIVNAITAGENGVLWIGTYNGLVKYDGVGFTIFHGGVTIPGKMVNTCAVDSENVKWFGLKEGLASFDGQNWKLFTTREGLPSNDIKSVFVDQNNVKWIGANSGIASIDNLVVIKYNEVTRMINSITADSKNNLYAASNLGDILRLQNDKWELFTARQSSVNDIIFDNDDSLIVADEDNVWKYDGAEWKPLTGKTIREIVSLAVDKNNGVWFATRTGNLYHYTGEALKGTSFSKPITSVSIDKNENVWVTLAGFGVRKYREIGLDRDVYTTDKCALLSDNVFSGAPDKNGVLWFGTDEGVSSFNPGYGKLTELLYPKGGENFVQGTLVNIEWSVKSDYIRTVSIEYSDDNGITWTVINGKVNAAGGLFVWEIPLVTSNECLLRIVPDYDLSSTSVTPSVLSILPPKDWQKGWKRYTAADGFTDDKNINSVAPDNNGGVWVGTDGKGLFHFDGQNWVNDISMGVNIRALGCDNNNTIWVTYPKGTILSFDGSSWKTYLTGLYGPVDSFAVDKDNNLWIGPYLVGKDKNGNDDCCLFKYNGTEFIRYGSEDYGITGFPHDYYYDNNNVFWMTIGNFLISYDGQKWTKYPVISDIVYDHFPFYLVSFYLGRDGKKWFTSNYGIAVNDGSVWSYYHQADGLASSYIYSVAIDNDGILWCTSEDGISVKDGNKWRTFNTSNSLLVDNLVRKVVVDKNNIKWFYGNGGLVSYNDNESTSVEQTDEKPAALSIKGNYPNPFNPSTSISYTIPKSGFVALTIYGINSQKIRELISGNVSEGTHTVVWDGRDSSGKQVSSGIYFSRLVQGKQKAVGKMLLVK